MIPVRSRFKPWKRIRVWIQANVYPPQIRFVCRPGWQVARPNKNERNKKNSACVTFTAWWKFCLYYLTMWQHNFGVTVSSQSGKVTQFNDKYGRTRAIWFRHTLRRGFMNVNGMCWIGSAHKPGLVNSKFRSDCPDLETPNRVDLGLSLKSLLLNWFHCWAIQFNPTQPWLLK